MIIWIRVGEEAGEAVRAVPLSGARARLQEIPHHAGLNVFDMVRYDPDSAEETAEGTSYRLAEVLEPSGYRAYLAWAVLHQPADFPQWRTAMREQGIVVRSGEWETDRVRQMLVALPPTMSALAALVTFNRHARIVEIVCPLLAAHADDLDRAKSDLERAVAWGAPDPELTLALAEAFEAEQKWDEAVTFWERLAHALPNDAAARERLALAYARLGVYHMAASEFDRAADLSDDPSRRDRLAAARDLMWERSRV